MEEEMKNMLKFMVAASKACKELGKKYEFECPICGGIAGATRVVTNEHLWAACSKCNRNVVQ